MIESNIEHLYTTKDVARVRDKLKQDQNNIDPIHNPYVDKVFTNSKWGSVKIIKYVSSKCVLAEFVDTGYTVKTTVNNIKKGRVKDLRKPSVLGVGVLGDEVDQSSENFKVIYKIWFRMLERCYTENFRQNNVAYKECFASENFKQFTFFYHWCQKQTGFGKRRWELDKDILVKGNKMYSEETCCFIPDEINCLIGMKKNRGKYPAGVTWNKGAKAFRSKVRVYGKDKHLGYYKTSEEAFYAYKKAKEQYVKEVANNWTGQIDNKVYEALMKWEINIDD